MTPADLAPIASVPPLMAGATLRTGGVADCGQADLYQGSEAYRRVTPL
jgi:hypothetical protein